MVTSQVQPTTVLKFNVNIDEIINYIKNTCE